VNAKRIARTEQSNEKLAEKQSQVIFHFSKRAPEGRS
jgi:hypothetical protein